MKKTYGNRSLTYYKVVYTISDIIKYITLIIGAAIAIVPILVVFFASLKTAAEYATSGAISLPKHITFANYIYAFKQGNMLTGFKNTFLILLVSLVGRIFLGTTMAYVLHRFKFKVRNIILALFLTATFVPGIVSNIVIFKMISAMNLYNTLFSVMLLGIGTDVISMYIFLQFLDRIPVSLDESAMIDGASYFTIYWKIILPLLKPAIVTVCIINGVGIYNDFYTPFLYMPDPAYRTISTALYNFKGPMGAEWQNIAACVMIVIIPTLVIFIALQKYIYEGVSGSVK